MEYRKKAGSLEVIMAVYRGDNPADFHYAMESVYFSQTRKPEKIILVCDGPLHEDHERVITEFAQRTAGSILHVIRVKKNLGLANALNVGIDASMADYVARMDADDIALPSRFAKQLDFFEKNKGIDI